MKHSDNFALYLTNTREDCCCYINLLCWIAGGAHFENVDFISIPMLFPQSYIWRPVDSFIHSWLCRPLFGPGLFFSFLILFTQTVGLPGRGISPSQGHYLHTGRHKHRINAYTDIHALIGIRTHDPSVWASEDSSCLRPHYQCDRSEFRTPCCWIYSRTLITLSIILIMLLPKITRWRRLSRTHWWKFNHSPVSNLKKGMSKAVLRNTRQPSWRRMAKYCSSGSIREAETRHEVRRVVTSVWSVMHWEKYLFS
jgi:hypothetical protein